MAHAKTKTLVELVVRAASAAEYIEIMLKKVGDEEIRDYSHTKSLNGAEKVWKGTKDDCREGLVLLPSV